MLVMLLGQSRVLYTMSARRPAVAVGWQDSSALSHALPHVDRGRMLRGRSSPRSSRFVFLAKLVSLGTLLAFTIVCLGVWVMRVREPDVPRPFRTPAVPLVPILGVIISVALMLSLDLPAWVGFGSWMLFGLIIYFSYSRKHSTVQRQLASRSTVSREPASPVVP